MKPRKSSLEEIPTTNIVPNPHNPRIAFRQAELDELQESIRRYGVQVPIAVYRDGRRFVLIDGERRWRCSLKLNRSTIPALIQQKPSEFENLLLMFNIHALREQWDLLTIALKLPEVIDLFSREEGRPPTEGDLASATGLGRGVIRRCKLLMELPSHYKRILLEELKKPKGRQQLSEDLFIEMEKALKTAARAMPTVVSDREAARQTLLKKYKSGVIRNVVDFRKLAKIARAEHVGADPAGAAEALHRLVTDPGYSIDDAYNQTVSVAYAERDVAVRIDALLSRLEELAPEDLDDELRDKLERLIARGTALLESEE